METELKQCPFCGRTPKLEHEYAGCGWSYIQCLCGVSSFKFPKDFSIASDAQAIEFWNRRAEDATD